MPTLVDVIYSGPSPIHAGNPISGGGGIPSEWATPSSVRTVLMGDSLTTHLLGYNWSPFFWINGLAGGVLQLVANLGVAGETLGDMAARVDNLYTDVAPGFAGLGQIGHIFFRGLTNNARQGDSAASLEAPLAVYLTHVATYGDVVYLLSVPPIGPTEANYVAKNALTLQYNDLLIAFAAANPTQFVYIPDSDNLRANDGTQLLGFQSDGIHNNGYGTYKEGIDAYADLATIFDDFAYPSPIRIDSTWKYPAHAQWFPNPGNTGTGGGASSGFTGQVIDGVGIGANGGGITGTCSIQAADSDDPDQTPWQMIAPTQVTRTGAGESIRISASLSGRAITTVDPVALDTLIELRFEAFDTNYFSGFNLWVQGNTGSVLTQDLALKMGGAMVTKSGVVLRHMMPRPTATANTAAALYFDAIISGNKTGGLGKFGFRHIQIEG